MPDRPNPDFGWDLPPGCSQADCDGEAPLAARIARRRSEIWLWLVEDICHQSVADGAALEVEALETEPEVESDLERDRRLR